MMSMKQDSKRISGDSMSSGPVIRVGPIINPGTNETISIIVPLSPSGQLSGLPSRIITERTTSGKDSVETRDVEVAGTIINERDSKLERSRISVSQTEHQSLILGMSPSNETTGGKLTAPLSLTSSANLQHRADKTKGCPFPTCSRYGRAFSRAHDLKRHIARHETRKERLVETSRGDIRTCSQCGESFLNEAILQRHERTHSKHQESPLPLVLTTTSSSIIAAAAAAGLGTMDPLGPRNHCYPCNVCKKKYNNENKLKEHLVTHDEKSENNVCLLCGCEFDEDEQLQNHMREHTTSMLQAQQAQQQQQQQEQEVSAANGATEKSLIRVIKEENVVKEEIMAEDGEEDEDDDEFMLEEMLLLNKNPRLTRCSAGTSSSVNNSVAPVMPAVTSVTSSSSSSPNIVGNNKIRCDYCQKTFKTKWTLSSHVAAHEGRFQFGCTRCGKKFVRKSHFEGHVRSHEAARPYVCEQCGKTFKELKHRREHTKRKHPGNQNAIQNLLDSISACVSEESSVGEQAKFTLLMPVNFGA